MKLILYAALLLENALLCGAEREQICEIRGKTHSVTLYSVVYARAHMRKRSRGRNPVSSVTRAAVRSRGS